MDDPLPPLRGSVSRLRQLCLGLDDDRLEAQSYCDDWTVSGVLSHLGSAAVIMGRRLQDALAGRETPDDFAPSVWEEWNAKSARVRVDDALEADGNVLEALEAVRAADRARLTFPMGPVTFGFDEFAGARLNEHAFHSWDIAVVFDDAAQIPLDAASVVVDNLALVARFTGRPTGAGRQVAIRTTGPRRDFVIGLSAGGVELTAAQGGSAPDLELPAEAFCRLVYGRLDPGHTPVFTGDPTLLDTMRAVFPGP